MLVKMPKLLPFLLLCFGFNVFPVHSYTGLLLVRTTAQVEEEYCILYASDSLVPKSYKDAEFFELVIFNESEWEACMPLRNSSQNVENKMVMVSNGTCEVYKKTLIATDEHASGLIIVQASQNKTKPANETKPGKFKAKIPVIFITEDLSKTLVNFGPGIKVAVYDPTSPLDWILVVMWITAMFCIIVGAYWAGVDYYVLVSQQTSSGSRRSQVNPELVTRYTTSQRKMTYISIAFIIALVLIMCGFLLLIYFFYNTLVYIVIALFFVATAISLFVIIDALTHYLIPWRPWQIPEFRFCGTTYKVEYTQILLGIMCISVSAFWVYVRNDDCAWILQDFLGVCFCICILQCVRLPNMMVITLLLVLLFFYDIFFVFITPYLTKSENSIMVDVATGGPSSNGEKMPLIFTFPHLSRGPLGKCTSGVVYSVLGFGDVLIPGMAIAFVHGFDLEVKSRRAYFISSVIAYGIGLIITFMGLSLIRKPQPALLYLVPCVLLTIYTVALIRHEVKDIWKGKPSPKTDDQAPQERLQAAGTPTQDTSESASSSGFPSTSEAAEERRLIDQPPST